MGNDGGSIPTRRELVKEAARQPSATQLKESQHEQQAYHWTTCPLSKRPLQRPVVSDSKGKLYNKDSILEFLIPDDEDDGAKAEADKILLGSVKSLKDVVELKFEIDEDATTQAKANGGLGFEIWKCPITNKVLGPGVKAVYLVPCGHVFEAAAVREVAEGKCPQCDQEYAPNDAIPILPTSEEDVLRLSLRVNTLKEKGLAHSLKKGSGKKRKKHADAENGVEDSEKAEKKKKAKGENGEISGIKNCATASLTQKVRDELEEQKKKRKLQRNENLEGLFSSRDPTATRKNNDFMNRGFTIPANGTK